MMQDNKNEKQKSGSGQISKNRIGEKLRQLYTDVASEPVPDEFLRLLEEADDALNDDDQEKPS